MLTITRSSAVAVIAIRTEKCTVQLQNNRCQHEYLLIYSFKLKSAFDAGNMPLMPLSFLADHHVLWLIHPTAIRSEDVNRKCPARNMTIQLSTPYTDPECHSAQWHRQTDR